MNSNYGYGEGGDDSSQVSKYNDAGLSVSRLHESWLLCKIYIRRGKLFSWKTELDNVWMELITDVIRQDDSDKLMKKNEILMEKISQSKNRYILYTNLMKRHCFMRELQDLVGKAGVYVDANSEGFE